MKILKYLFHIFCIISLTSCLSDYEKSVKKVHKQFMGSYAISSQNFDNEKLILNKIEFVKCENYNYRSASPNYTCQNNIITVDGKEIKFGYSYDGDLDEITIFPDVSQSNLSSNPNLSKTADMFRGFWKIEINKGNLKAKKMQNYRGYPAPFNYTFEAKKL